MRSTNVVNPRGFLKRGSLGVYWKVGPTMGVRQGETRGVSLTCVPLGLSNIEVQNRGSANWVLDGWVPKEGSPRVVPQGVLIWVHQGRDPLKIRWRCSTSGVPLERVTWSGSKSRCPWRGSAEGGGLEGAVEAFPWSGSHIWVPTRAGPF